jgi:hypothetical protein
MLRPDARHLTRDIGDETRCDSYERTMPRWCCGGGCSL